MGIDVSGEEIYKATFKFNNGNGAVLCSNCNVIIRQGAQLTKQDLRAMTGFYFLGRQYCDKCKKQ